ncbi:hypothetical protein [Pedobacter sp. UBA5917]|jgi:hypothetical protein|uniref:hypothetical protein n=1 Tax=Pedobacter sp. UBA5917 TaxID=1947061 RepID=UPI002600BECA|nr:hypothetical protein [Pedobacter sp. UBA5917]
MKKLIVILLLIQANFIYAQKNLFKTLKVDKTTKIIGRHQLNDTTYKKYNFIIEDSAQIAVFIKHIKLGDEIVNSLGNPNFSLSIIQNQREIGSWTITPYLKRVMVHDGHTYQFEMNQIAELNKFYPFDYKVEDIVFKQKTDYEKYLAEQQKKPDFLFHYAPSFKYEGSFEIEFKKSSKFPHPKAIMEFLDPYLLKILSKNEFAVLYKAGGKNMEDPDQYTITVMGPKKLYDELKIDNLKNENWQPTEEQAHFYYKK